MGVRIDGQHLFDIAAKEGAHIFRGLFIAQSRDKKDALMARLYMIEEAGTAEAVASAHEAMVKALEGKEFFKGRLHRIGSPGSLPEFFDSDADTADTLAPDAGVGAQMQFLEGLMDDDFIVQLTIATKDAEHPKIITVPYQGKLNKALVKKSFNVTVTRSINDSEVMQKAMGRMDKLKDK
jgi:hypothetical protein